MDIGIDVSEDEHMLTKQEIIGPKTLCFPTFLLLLKESWGAIRMHSILKPNLDISHIRPYKFLVRFQCRIHEIARLIREAG